jgi:hypothetical protein
MTTEEELHARRKKKNYAILIALALFVVTVYAVTLIRMKGS